MIFPLVQRIQTLKRGKSWCTVAVQRAPEIPHEPLMDIANLPIIASVPVALIIGGM